MKERFMKFIKENYLLLILIFYGVFLIFYKWAGSFMGDEATYSLIAKEGLVSNSLFALHWKGQLWFEKPPLMIWLTMASFKLFGISETSAHIFPGLFGVLSAVVLYFLGKEIFKSKLAGFFAGFIFMATPIIFLYNRAVMMDIPVGMFISLSVLAALKIISGRREWWLVFGIALGLGIMVKSVIGLLAVPLLLCAIFIYAGRETLKDKFLWYGIFLAMLVVVPWHLYMSIKFGNFFWQDYLGHHIWQRFNSQILPYPWEGNSPIGYIKLFFERSGIWFWLFLVFSLNILGALFLFGKISKKKLIKIFWLWLRSHQKEWLFLYGWLILVTVPFFVSVTKLPNYMILAFFPLAIFIGGFLAYFFEENRKVALYLISLVSILNFLPILRLHASDFGEAHFLIPKLLIRFLRFDEKGLAYAMIACLALITWIFFKPGKHFRYLKFYALFILLGMNMLIPFNPMRNEFIKKLGQDITAFSSAKPVNLYFVMRTDQYSLPYVGAFYLPIGSSIQDVGNGRVKILPNNSGDFSSLCFIEKSFLNETVKSAAIFSYSEGVVSKCDVDKGA